MGSAILFLAAILAAVVANSSLGPAYWEFMSSEIHLQIGQFNLFSHGAHCLTVHELINDGLMAIFFFYVGLEIKRELLVGELSSFRKALLPFIAACGGMVAPVLIYMFICPPTMPGGQGLAIPMATDIAFSLGVLSLFGSRVPLALKVFLTAFAVVDDIGGILIIAIFYSTHVEISYLFGALLIFVLLYFIGKRSTSKTFIVIGGVIIWYLFLQSGIHSTISGVILAFVISARPELNVGKYIERIRRLINSFPTITSASIVLSNQQITKLKRVESASDKVISPLQSMEDNLHNTVNFIILPLFAFANAGVVFNTQDGAVIGSVTYAIGLGLVLGKFLGIFFFTWASVRMGITPMPYGMNLKNLAGVALLGGIGFTVSLFISNLSFGTDVVLLNQAKMGVIGGSFISGLLGFIVLNKVLPKKNLVH
jgi:Na+/H+ antiporter NhaA